LPTHLEILLYTENPKEILNSLCHGISIKKEIQTKQKELFLVQNLKKASIYLNEV